MDTIGTITGEGRVAINDTDNAASSASGEQNHLQAENHYFFSASQIRSGGTVFEFWSTRQVFLIAASYSITLFFHTFYSVPVPLLLTINKPF
jgi:hypothetical protein